MAKTCVFRTGSDLFPGSSKIADKRVEMRNGQTELFYKNVNAADLKRGLRAMMAADDADWVTLGALVSILIEKENAS